MRCPCCGCGQLFKSAFRLHERCSACDEPFEREPGQWFGAVYINLGLTQVLAVTGFLLTESFTSLTMSQQIALWLPAAIVGPIVFHRVATGLWASIIFLGEGLYLAWPNR